MTSLTAHIPMRSYLLVLVSVLCPVSCSLVSCVVWQTPEWARNSHLYIPCRSVCNRDQNWIKRSKPGGDQGIKVTSKLLKINNQECMAAIWPLTLENQAIKSLRRRWSSDQAHFADQKNLITVTNASTGDIYKWLSLDGVECFNSSSAGGGEGTTACSMHAGKI